MAQGDYYAAAEETGCWLLIRDGQRVGLHGPNCVDRSHLEPVKIKANRRRTELAKRNAERLTCSKGHPFSPENTYQRPGSHGRGCVTCKGELKKAWRERRRSASLPYM